VGRLLPASESKLHYFAIAASAVQVSPHSDKVAVVFSQKLRLIRSKPSNILRFFTYLCVLLAELTNPIR
jgi:hypothetical protein